MTEECNPLLARISTVFILLRHGPRYSEIFVFVNFTFLQFLRKDANV